MVIFHSYVSLPEGNYERLVWPESFANRYISFQMRICLSGICRSEKRQKPHEQFFTTEIWKLEHSETTVWEPSKSYRHGLLKTTRSCPPVPSWSISPLTIDISPINHSYWSYKPHKFPLHPSQLGASPGRISPPWFPSPLEDLGSLPEWWRKVDLLDKTTGIYALVI